MTDDQRWKKAADRENARRDARAPLFAHAGLVPHTTADAQEAKVARVQGEMAERFAAHDEASRRRIDVMRQDLRALVGDGALAAFDVRRKWWPKSPEYELDGLTEEIAKATSRTPREVHESYKARLRVGEPRRVESLSSAAALPGDAAEHEDAAVEEGTAELDHQRRIARTL